MGHQYCHLEHKLCYINYISLPVKVFASLGAAQAFATVNSRLKTWQQMENKAAAVEPATAT